MRGYACIVTYASSADLSIAHALQRGLAQLAKPPLRPRSLEVFVAPDVLSTGGFSDQTVARAMETSEWFVLLASPESAASDEVGLRISQWLATRGVERFLTVVTDGGWEWDDAAADLDWERSSAAHPALRGAFTETPRHVDLSWARSSDDLTLRNARFRNAVADIGAPLHGLPKDELDSDDIRQLRRRRRFARMSVASVAVLAIGAVAGGLVAASSARESDRQRDRAVAQARVALAGRLASTVAAGELDQDVALITAAHAYDLDAAAGRAALWNALSQKQLASQGELELVTSTDETFQAVLAGNGAKVTVGAHVPSGHRTLATTDDGQTFVRLDTDGDAYHLERSSGQLSATLESISPSTDPEPSSVSESDAISSGASGSARTFHFSATGEQVYSLDATGELTIWNTDDGSRMASMSDVLGAERLDDELLVLTVDALVVVDVGTGEPIRSKPATVPGVRAIASNGARLALATSSGRVVVSDLDTGAVELDIDANVGSALYTALSDDGSWLAVAGISTYSVIDVGAGSVLFTSLTPVESLRFVARPDALEFDRSTNSFVLSADGRFLSASLAADTWRDLACELAQRDLTEEEFATIVGGRFEVTCG